MGVTADRASHPGSGEHDPGEVERIARGIATSVAPSEGLTEVQASLLQAIASALTGIDVDYHDLEPLGPDELAAVLAPRDLHYRQRIVHHMVLGELVLRPLPVEVATRVAKYAEALGVDDQFVRVARRYAQGAFGLAWMDLQRSGFTDHVRQLELGPLPKELSISDPFAPPTIDPVLEALWRAFQELPEGTLGRAVWEMYDGRGFALPGTAEGPCVYLAQHDFVHVLADYGTNLKGELEVFAFIGRSDPDPKGFAWLATLVGLFETGFIADSGFFERDVRERHIQTPGMQHRIADAILRGRTVCERYGVDLLDVDYHSLAGQPVDDVRAALRIPDKSTIALSGGSVGVFDLEGCSEMQRRSMEVWAKRQGVAP